MEAPPTLRPCVTYEFEVEKIIGISSDGRYQVQCAPAWVGRSHLVGCENLIQQFLHEQWVKEKLIQQESQPEAEHGNQPEAQDDVSPSEDNENVSSVDLRIPEQTPREETMESFTVKVGVTDERIDSEDSPGASIREFQPANVSEESYLKFVSLINGLMDSSMTEKEPKPIAEQPTGSKDALTSEVSTEQLLPVATNVSYCTHEIHRSSNSLKFSEGYSSEGDSIQLPLQISAKLGDSSRLCQSSGIRSQKYVDAHGLHDRMEFNQENKNAKHKKTFTKQPWCCTYCKKSFNREAKLKAHILTRKAGQAHCGSLVVARPFTCGHCGKAFIHKHHLQEHVSLHTGDRPYSCQDCGKTFPSSSKLNSHKLSYDHSKASS